MARDRTLPLSEYAQELRQWLQLTRQSQMIASSALCYHAYTISQTTSRPQSTPTSPPAPQPLPRRAFPVDAGTEVKIPGLGKRVVAEVIDCLLLLCVKFFISYLLITLGGFKAVQILDFDYALLNGELDVDKFLSLSSEILFVELVHRLFVSIYEAVCLAYVTNIIPPGGATIGKKFMGLAVVGCDEVFSLGGDRFLVTGITNPPLFKTLCRSLMKNFSLSLMVPTCVTAFMFNHRRAVYDLLVGTVVIETV